MKIAWVDRLRIAFGAAARPAFAGLAIVAALVACTPVGGERYTRKQAEKSIGKLEKSGISVGEFRLTKVVDGDTVWVDGLDKSLRLLGIDAEETFKNEADRRAVETDWNGYLKAKRNGGKRPVKLATPLGEQAKAFGKVWFEGVGKVRVERDHPAEIRDRYDRFLAYVLANKGGVWQNYNVELVRAGLSPYFSKYGYSRRYHKDFVAALAEAKAAGRGIWATGTMHAPDYPERETWWFARGDFVDEFRKEGEGKSDYIDLTHWDTKKLLEDHIGKEVHVLGTVDELIRDTKGPARVNLGGPKGGFPLIFFDRSLLTATGLAEWKGEYVIATGIVNVYTNKNTKRSSLQIQIERTSQIKLSSVPGLSLPTAEPAPAAANP
ncbi:MAG: thermonuclease family protein [Kofleriaceae bacterium]